MDDNKKVKYFISMSEGLIFVLLIATTLLAIFDLLSNEILYLTEIFSLWSLRSAIILFLIFISLPFLVTYLKKLSDKAFVKYNQRKFKKYFFNELQELQEEEIHLLSLSRKYDVNFIFVKNYLRDQIASGLLRGEMKDDIFYIQEDFKIMDLKERRIEFMRLNVGKFISPHRWIKIKDIVNNFKIPKDVVISFLKKLINEGVLRGYIEGETFIRDLSLPEEIECPHCKKKFNPRENEETIQ